MPSGISQIMGAIVVVFLAIGALKLVKWLGSRLWGQISGPQYGKAAKWALRAAELGSAEGQRTLGIHFEQGQGVRQDHVEAYMWYLLSEEGGDTAAALHRQKLKPSLSTEQIAEAERRAKDWRAKHPKQ